MTPELKAEITKLLKARIPPKEIMARHPGTCPFYISRLRRKLGLKRFFGGRTLGGEAKSRKLPNGELITGNQFERLIRSLKSDGHSYRCIGNAFGMSAQRIQQMLKIKNVKRNGVCKRCKKSFRGLHAHHVSYKTNNHYELLCTSCHAKMKKTKFFKLYHKRKKELLASQPKYPLKSLTDSLYGKTR